MKLQQAWVTRMELSLPRTGLTDDLVLAANEDQNGVGSNPAGHNRARGRRPVPRVASSRAW